MRLTFYHRKLFSNRSSTLIVLAFFLFWITYTEGPASAQVALQRPCGDTVRVSILSKSLRELKEQSLSNISFTFPDQTRLFNKTSGDVIELQKMSISRQDSQFLIQCNREPYKHPRRFSIQSSTPNTVFKVQIGGEKRIYPLPLDVLESNGEIILVIEENKSRYALDSAAAEMGHTSERQKEALYALGLLILSGIDMTASAPPHANFRFCDLTHCQVYIGRKAAKYELFNVSWRIDDRQMPGLPHFHARCGGRTLGGRVFGPAGDAEIGVSDILTRRGIYLCTQKAYEWEKSISARDLADIVFSDNQKVTLRKFSVDYNKDQLMIHVTDGETIQSLAPEDFRLKLNRVHGWNFLPSNYYDVSRQDTPEGLKFFFKGKGLGHGAGLCQAGALKLASLGYSRYDILRHYFPDIRFIEAIPNDNPIPPDISYFLFSLKTGHIEQTGHPAFIYRQVPSGSIFKLFVSLYLATEQPSLLTGYHFRCPEDADANMPTRCWLGKGHGDIGFAEALAHSCNLYFGSLHRHILQDNFFTFFNKVCRSTDMAVALPDIKTKQAFSRLLIGLDHRTLFSIQDLIKLTQIISPLESDIPAIESIKQSITPGNKAMISEALLRTMKDGTGSQSFLHPINTCNTLWGKTATVADGTNRPMHYGIFIGGCDKEGIILIRRNAVGRDAAKSAIAIFTDQRKNYSTSAFTSH